MSVELSFVYSGVEKGGETFRKRVVWLTAIR